MIWLRFAESCWQENRWNTKSKALCMLRAESFMRRTVGQISGWRKASCYCHRQGSHDPDVQKHRDAWKTAMMSWRRRMVSGAAALFRVPRSANPGKAPRPSAARQRMETGDPNAFWDWSKGNWRRCVFQKLKTAPSYELLDKASVYAIIMMSRLPTFHHEERRARFPYGRQRHNRSQQAENRDQRQHNSFSSLLAFLDSSFSSTMDSIARLDGVVSAGDYWALTKNTCQRTRRNGCRIRRATKDLPIQCTRTLPFNCGGAFD